MTPDQTRIVQTTWQNLVPVADVAARLFYGRLFELDPALRQLFHGVDLEVQQNSLTNVLAHVIGHLDNLDALVPDIQALGRRHAGYGVTDEHYEVVGAALIWTLEQGLRPNWTPEVKAAWTAAYTLLSNVMRQAAHQEQRPASAA